MYDEKFQPHPDPEMREFEEALLRSIDEANAGKYAAVHTSEQIVARSRGRPAGSVQAITKEPVKIRLDADVLVALRNSGAGWQTRINDMLRASLQLAGRL